MWLGLLALGVLCALGVWLYWTGFQGQNPQSRTPHSTATTPSERQAASAGPRPHRERHTQRAFSADPPVSDQEEAMRAILPHTTLGWVRCTLPPHLSTAEIHGFESYASVHTAEDQTVTVSMGVESASGALVLTAPYQPPDTSNTVRTLYRRHLRMENIQSMS